VIFVIFVIIYLSSIRLYTNNLDCVVTKMTSEKAKEVAACGLCFYSLLKYEKYEDRKTETGNTDPIYLLLCCKYLVHKTCHDLYFSQK
jgi:hypothetical protein